MRLEQLYLENMGALIRLRLRSGIAESGAEENREELTEELKRKELVLGQLAARAGLEAEFLPFEYVFACFNCNEFERHVLWLLAAYELDPGVAAAAEAVHRGQGIRFVTPYMAQLSFPGLLPADQVHQAFGGGSLLERLLVQQGEAYRGDSLRRLELRPRLKAFLLDGCLRSWQGERFWEVIYPGDRLDEFIGGDRLVGQLERLWRKIGPDGAVLRVWGLPGSGRRLLLRHVAAQLNTPLALLNLEALAWDGEDIWSHLEAFCLECRLQGAVPALCGERREYWESGGRIKEVWRTLYGEFGRVWSVAERGIFPGEELPCSRVFRVHVKQPDLLESKTLWEEMAKRYPMDGDAAAGELGNRYRLSPGKIKLALEEALSLCLLQGNGKITRNLLRQGCGRILNQELSNKAVRIDPVYGWDQLILPAKQKEQLKRACDQVTYRHQVYGIWGMEQTMAYGRGVSLIFAGAPGTGKTMAAQVLAREIGLELYKVELAAVVSKYIGETEKNLEEIFEQAGRGQFILFFDEADVLFGKRTEIKDSNDKYSNMEAAFMLQKIEEYEGITILATNYLQNFDEAFKRRIKFLIDFPLPDAGARKDIWKRTIPEAMPLEEVDWEYLSRFGLSGSNIKNAVLCGAFLAASAHKAVGMAELLQGIRQEFAKGGKILTREELGEYYLLFDGEESGDER